MLKDLDLIKKDIFSALLLGLGVFPVLSLTVSLPDWALFIFLFFSVFHLMNNTLKNDDKNKSTRFLLTLPLDLKTLIYSKYLTLFTLIILFFWWGGVIFLINQSIGWQPQNSLFEFLTPVILYPLLIFSLILPLYFKFGYFKAIGFAQVLALVSVLIFFHPGFKTPAIILNHFLNSGLLLLFTVALLSFLSIKLSDYFFSR